MPWFVAMPFFHYWNFKKKEAYHMARFEKESRYYILRLEKDLLNDWTITAINGRIKSKLGQNRILAFSSFSDAFKSFCDLAKLRYQRNYHLKLVDCNISFLLPFQIQDEQSQRKAQSTGGRNLKKAPMKQSPVKISQSTHQQMGLLF